MCNKDGDLEDTKILITDSLYDSIHQESISSVKTKGYFDASIVDNVANISIMSQKSLIIWVSWKPFDSPACCVVTFWYNINNKVYFEHKLDKIIAWHVSLTTYETIKDSSANKVKYSKPIIFSNGHIFYTLCTSYISSWVPLIWISKCVCQQVKFYTKGIYIKCFLIKYTGFHGGLQQSVGFVNMVETKETSPQKGQT